MTALEHWKKFRPAELTVREFDHWLVVVRGKQVTLGSVVFLPKRAIPALGEMSHDESAEMPTVARWFERVTKELYGAERFNYVAAMMKDPFVHFHAFPRYSSARSAHDIEWRDEAWPRVIEFKDVDTSDEVLLDIHRAMSQVEV
ncbi:HIT family protein [Lentzea sp. NPDC058436]|uniref:HIT family protein n=1 Tax=Lentzea sp. NPDC058436 TaxID=3346499 RepID=UPI00366278C2